MFCSCFNHSLCTTEQREHVKAAAAFDAAQHGQATQGHSSIQLSMQQEADAIRKREMQALMQVSPDPCSCKPIFCNATVACACICLLINSLCALAPTALPPPHAPRIHVHLPATIMISDTELLTCCAQTLITFPACPYVMQPSHCCCRAFLLRASRMLHHAKSSEKYS